jgi:hypothetical protein
MCAMISNVTLLLGLLLVAATTPVISQTPEQVRHASCSSVAQGSEPKFTIARREYDGSRPHFLLLHVSVKPADVYFDSLVLLSCKLKNEFATESRIMVRVFSDSVAAKRFVPLEDAPHLREDMWQLRGLYLLDKQNGEEYVEFLRPALDRDLLSPVRIKVILANDK